MLGLAVDSYERKLAETSSCGYESTVDPRRRSRSRGGSRESFMTIFNQEFIVSNRPETDWDAPPQSDCGLKKLLR